MFAIKQQVTKFVRQCNARAAIPDEIARLPAEPPARRVDEGARSVVPASNGKPIEGVWLNGIRPDLNAGRGGESEDIDRVARRDLAMPPHLSRDCLALAMRRHVSRQAAKHVDTKGREFVEPVRDMPAKTLDDSTRQSSPAKTTQLGRVTSAYQQAGHSARASATRCRILGPERLHRPVAADGALNTGTSRSDQCLRQPLLNAALYCPSQWSG